MTIADAQPTRLQDRTDCANLTATQRRSHYAGGCRTQLCTAAATEYNRARRLAGKTKPKEPAPPPTTAVADDTASTDEGAPAQSVPERSPKAEPMVFSLPTCRRLRALAVIGITPQRVAQVSGLKPNTVWWLTVQPPTEIPLTVHKRIEGTFKRLRLEPVTPDAHSPSGQHAAQAVLLAEEQGWAGPFDWDHIDTDTTESTRRVHRDTQALQDAVDAARLEAGLVDADDDTGRLRRENETLNTSLAEAQDTIAGLRVDMASAWERTNSAEKAAHTLTAELEGNANASAQLAEELRTAVQDRADALQRAEDAENARQAAQDAFDRERAHHATTEHDLDTARQPAEDARQEAQRVTGQLELARADLERLRAGSPDRRIDIPATAGSPVTVTITLGAAS